MNVCHVMVFVGMLGTLVSVSVFSVILLELLVAPVSTTVCIALVPDTNLTPPARLKSQEACSGEY